MEYAIVGRLRKIAEYAGCKIFAPSRCHISHWKESNKKTAYMKIQAVPTAMSLL